MHIMPQLEIYCLYTYPLYINMLFSCPYLFKQHQIKTIQREKSTLENTEAPEILREEVRSALKKMNGKKATDEII